MENINLQKSFKKHKLAKKITNIMTSVLSDPEITAICYEVKAYNTYLYQHSIQVAIYSVCIGDYLEYDFDELKNLFLSGILHDIGKLYVPKSILNKPAQLDKQEFDVIKLHPLMGYMALIKKGIINKDILDAVLYHHERMDGSGYYFCKKEDEISEFARIISVADVYDAMISDRVYRKGMRESKVKEYLLDTEKSKLDRVIVDILLKIIEDRFLVNEISASVNYILDSKISDQKFHIV